MARRGRVDEKTVGNFRLKWLLFVLLLSSCRHQVPYPQPWECHVARAYAVYPTHACVIHTI